MTSMPSRCFAPAVTPDIRVLILGSLPGEASLAKQQYYGHPRNHFWHLMSAITGVDLLSLEYEARLAQLNCSGIGLWDVVARAVRPGSLDQHLREVVPNGLADFIAGLEKLEAIAFNGSSASKIGRRQIGDASTNGTASLVLFDLPSSSPANTMAYARKSELWMQLAPYSRYRPYVGSTEP